MSLKDGQVPSCTRLVAVKIAGTHVTFIGQMNEFKFHNVSIKNSSQRNKMRQQRQQRN